VSILFSWHSLVMTLGLALANDAYTHILLILPLSAALIYLDSKTPGFEIRGFESVSNRFAAEPSHRSGTAGSGFAVQWLCAVGDGTTIDDVRLSLGMFALVTWWITSSLR